jgi:hypothetical protein
MLPTNATAKPHFVAYDIFGYLLPASLLASLLLAANSAARRAIASLFEGATAIEYSALTVGLYVGGHLIAAVSALVLEQGLLKTKLGYPTTHLFPASSKPNTPWAIFSGPSYETPYSEDFRRRFDRLFFQTFDVQPTDDHDRFWLCWSYVSLHHPAAFARGSHFLSLYGFARNISMSFLFGALIPLLPGWEARVPGLLWSGVSVGLAWGMFASYTRLLRRLNDETYRGFLAVVSKRYTAA